VKEFAKKILGPLKDKLKGYSTINNSIYLQIFWKFSKP